MTAPHLAMIWGLVWCVAGLEADLFDVKVALGFRIEDEFGKGHSKVAVAVGPNKLCTEFGAQIPLLDSADCITNLPQFHIHIARVDIKSGFFQAVPQTVYQVRCALTVSAGKIRPEALILWLVDCEMVHVGVEMVDDGADAAKERVFLAIRPCTKVDWWWVRPVN